MTNTLVPFNTRYPSLFEDFRREMDNLVSRFYDGSGGMNDLYSPLANVSETDDHYEIVLDLPGIDPDVVNVEWKHGDLWITGERKWADEGHGKHWLSRECHYGRFQRVFRLTDEIDVDKVDAEYKDGVLRILAPKSEAAIPRRINIRN